MSKINVAIIQNRVQQGGRLQVIIEIVRVLNELGIQPDILTFKSRLSRSDIISNYNAKIDFKLKEIFFDVRIPFELHILFFNLICNNYLKEYDLIINNKKSKVIEQEFRSGECHYSSGSKFSVAMSATTTWKTLPGEVGIYDRIQITAIFQGT